MNRHWFLGLLTVAFSIITSLQSEPIPYQFSTHYRSSQDLLFSGGAGLQPQNPYFVMPQDRLEILAIDPFFNPFPTKLPVDEVDYFRHLTRCCTQNCCFNKGGHHTFEGVDEKFGCTTFEDNFCCCCSCCCCEEDYYGEGIGAGVGVGMGGAAGFGTFGAVGAGGSGGTNGTNATDNGTTTGTEATTTTVGPTTVIIPEPSIYLILASALLIAIYAAARRKKTSLRK